MSFSSANSELQCLDATTQVHVQMDLVQVTYTLHFQPPTHAEGEFAFALPKDSIISQLVILSGTTRIVAEVKEKDQALTEYSDSISQGQTAFVGIVDEDNNDLMTFHVSTLEVGQSLCAELTIVTTSTFDSIDNNWVLTISPLSTATVRECSIELSMSSEVTISNSQDFSMTQTHPCMVQLTKAGVTGPVRVVYTCTNTYEPALIVQRDEVRQITAVFLSHQLQTKDVSLHDWSPKGEYVIVLDRSGSMSGNKIELAKQATQLFIQSLPPNSYFNVISFGTRFEAMFERSVEYSNDSASSAIRKIKSMDADFGGTKLYEPLKHVFETESNTDCPLYVFVITDGQVNNRSEVMNLVEEFSDKSKVSGIGVGTDVDKKLVDGIATAGHGTSMMITDANHLKKAVVSALKESLVPGILDIHVTNTDNFRLVYPLTPIHTFGGTRLHLGAVLREDSARELCIQYKDEHTAQTKTDRFLFDHTQIIRGSAAAVLTIGKVLRQMGEAHKVEVSVHFQVVCDKTALSGVAKTPSTRFARNVPSVSSLQRSLDDIIAMQTLSVETLCALEYRTELMDKSSNVFAYKPSIGTRFMNSIRSLFRSKRKDSAADQPTTSQSTTSQKLASPASLNTANQEITSQSARQPVLDSTVLLQLLEFQDVSGFWSYSSALVQLLAHILGHQPELPDTSNLTVTNAVLKVLHNTFPDKKDEWELIEAKAVLWMNSINV